MEKTIEIPEGYEARIEGNKVILWPKESEDERIREGFRKLLNGIRRDGGLTLNKVPLDKCFAYLEKQKEQKPKQSEDEKEYVRTLKSLISDFLRGKDEIDRGYYQKIYDWLDGRHIEQKPINQCNTHELTLDGARKWNEAYEKGYSLGYENGRNEQKPAEWSEEDDAILKEIVSFFRDGTVKLQHDLDLYAGFLEKKFKSLRPQPKQEWTEKDEARLGNLLSFLDGRLGILPGWKADCKNWLLSRFRALSPQPHWKPSKEQMEALGHIINHYALLANHVRENIESLYNNLKKL